MGREALEALAVAPNQEWAQEQCAGGGVSPPANPVARIGSEILQSRQVIPREGEERPQCHARSDAQDEQWHILRPRKACIKTAALQQPRRSPSAARKTDSHADTCAHRHPRIGSPEYDRDACQ